VLRTLLRLARSKVVPTKSTREEKSTDPWLDAFKKWGLPAPHGKPLILDGTSLRFVWPEHRVAADIGPFAGQVNGCADALGYAVVALPKAPSDAPPADLAGLLGTAP